MREILFRSRRIDNGEWAKGFYVHQQDSLRGDEAHFIFKPRKSVFEMCEVDPSTVGQYTGLSDRNGVRIFEGDVLSTPNGTFSNTGMGQIMFHNGIWLSYYGQDALDRDCFDELYAVCNSREVIGNIHDNPELMVVHHE